MPLLAIRLSLPRQNMALHTLSTLRKMMSKRELKKVHRVKLHRNLLMSILVTNGGGVDFALDAVGSAKILATGHKSLAKQGTLVTIGGAEPGAEATLPIGLHLMNGLTYRGTHQGDAAPRVHLPKLMDLWKSGTLSRSLSGSR